LAGRFASLLFSLNDNPQGREMLSRLPHSKFESANDQTYAPVKAYLKTFSETVRHIEY
jgi:phosphonate transport system substrate-binding protein